MTPGLGPPRLLALRPEELERLAREIEGTGWVRVLSPTSEHERLRAEAEGARFVLWRSGKLSHQGPRARALLEELARAAGLGPAAGQGQDTEVGSDEAGKGEWLGPMVVAAVALRARDAWILRLDGLQDSKELGAEQRARLEEPVRRRALASNVVVVGPKRFNELWDSMHARGQSLNDLLWWAHRKALEPVLAAVHGEPVVEVVLDEFDRTRRAEEEFRGLLPKQARVEQRPGAGERPGVAAASVLARTARDREVARLAEALGLDPKALTPEAAARHPRAAEFAKLAYLPRL